MTSSRSCQGHNRLVNLLALLDRLQHATHISPAEQAMTDFTFDLLRMPSVLNSNVQQSQTLQLPCMVFQKGDEAMLKDLQDHGCASRVILKSMSRFLGTASPEFYNSACIALVHLAFQSRSRSRLMMHQQAFPIVIRMMQTYRTYDYIQIIGIAALMVLGKNLGMATWGMRELEPMILQQILLAMEHHHSSSKVYVVACSAFGNLFGPGSSVMNSHGCGCNQYIAGWRETDGSDRYHRSLESIAYGLILHQDDHAAQGVGHALLCTMVGQDMAEEMITEVERCHGGVCCAPAA